MPGITLSEFQERRNAFVASLSLQARVSGKENHLVVIPAAPQAYMSQKVPYVYRQNSDFLYLTGCLEPDSVLVLNISQSTSSYKASIFVRERNAHSELWDGPRTGKLNISTTSTFFSSRYVLYNLKYFFLAGVDEASKLFDVDEALPIEHLNQYLTAYEKAFPNFMLWYDFHQPIDLKVHKILNMLVSDINSTAGKVLLFSLKLR